jgi:predicted phosphodiesterase
MKIGKPKEPKVTVYDAITTDMLAVALFDAHHDPENDDFHPAYKVARKYVLDVKPDMIILGGDWCTFDSLSNWNKAKPLIAEGKRYSDDWEVGYDELYFLKNKLPNTEFHFILGNHEERGAWYCQKNPSMQGTIDVRRDLGLYDLCETITDFEDFIQIGELAYTHGWYWGVYHAAMTMREFVGNVLYGHVHHFQSTSKNKHFRKKEYIAQSIGCLTDRYPEWKGKKPTRFQNGLATIEYQSDGIFNAYPNVIIDGTFSYGGYTWKA